MIKFVPISLVIPTYLRHDLLFKCLESISKQTLQPSEIIIINNGKKLIIQNTNINIINTNRNLGFAKSCNLGIIKSKNNLVGLVNDDTILDKNYIKQMMNEINKNNRSTIFCPKIYQDLNTNLLESTGDYIAKTYEFKHRGIGEIDNKQYDSQKNILLAPATASIYKKSLFEKIGYFDEDYHSYFEDVDLSLRGILNNQKYTFVPKAIVWHKGQSTSKFNSNKGYYEYRNSMITWIKCAPKMNINIVKILLLKYIKIVIINFKIKKIIILIKTILYLLLNYKKILYKRSKIQKNITISNNAFYKLFNLT